MQKKPSDFIERQQGLLASEAGRIAQLIEELEDEERNLENRRAVRREIAGMIEGLRRIEAERRRLVEEISTLDRSGAPAAAALARWERAAALQTARIEQEIEAWRQAHLAGRRRRRRDADTLATLEVEARRVREELERLRELRRGI